MKYQSLTKFICLSIAFQSLAGYATADLKSSAVNQYQVHIAAVQQEEVLIQNEADKLKELDQLMKTAELKLGNLYIIRNIARVVTPISVVATLAGLAGSMDKERPAQIVLAIAGVTLVTAVVVWVNSSVEIRMTEAEYNSYTRRREDAAKILDTRARALAALKEKLGVNTQNIQINQ